MSRFYSYEKIKNNNKKLKIEIYYNNNYIIISELLQGKMDTRDYLHGTIVVKKSFDLFKEWNILFSPEDQVYIDRDDHILIEFDDGKLIDTNLLDNKNYTFKFVESELYFLSDLRDIQFSFSENNKVIYKKYYKTICSLEDISDISVNMFSDWFNLFYSNTKSNNSFAMNHSYFDIRRNPAWIIYNKKNTVNYIRMEFKYSAKEFDQNQIAYILSEYLHKI